MKTIWLISISLLASSDLVCSDSGSPKLLTAGQLGGSSLGRRRITSTDSDDQQFHDCDQDSLRPDSMIALSGSPTSTPSPASTSLSGDRFMTQMSQDDIQKLALEWITATSPAELLKIDRIRELVTQQVVDTSPGKNMQDYVNLRLVKHEQELRILWQKEQNILVQRRVILVMGAFGAGLLSGSGLISNLGSRVIKRFNRLLFR